MLITHYLKKETMSSSEQPESTPTEMSQNELALLQIAQYLNQIINAKPTQPDLPGNYIKDVTFSDTVGSVHIGDSVVGENIEGTTIEGHVGDLKVGGHEGSTNTLVDCTFEKPVEKITLSNTRGGSSRNVCSGVVFKGKVGTFHMGNTYAPKKRERNEKKKEKKNKKQDKK